VQGLLGKSFTTVVLAPGAVSLILGQSFTCVQGLLGKPFTTDHETSSGHTEEHYCCVWWWGPISVALKHLQAIRKSIIVVCGGEAIMCCNDHDVANRETAKQPCWPCTCGHQSHNQAVLVAPLHMWTARFSMQGFLQTFPHGAVVLCVDVMFRAIFY